MSNLSSIWVIILVLLGILTLIFFASNQNSFNKGDYVYVNTSDLCNYFEVSKCQDISTDISTSFYINCHNSIYFTYVQGSKYGKSRYCTDTEEKIASNVIIENNYLIGDKVYFKGEKISGADVSTFKVIFEKSYLHYSSDENNVYIDKDIIEQADPRTFQVLRNGYSKDYAHVYYTGQIVDKENTIVDEAEPSLFKVFHCAVGINDFSQDSQFAYLRGDKLNLSDPSSFVVLDTDGKLFSVDEEKEIRCSYYSKDNNHVYYGNKLIEEADPSTFRKIEGESTRSVDKNNCYVSDWVANDFLWCKYLRNSS